MEQTIDPTLGPVLARTGDERAVLDSFLDFHRAVLLRKLRGLSDADARRRLVPSATTLAGLVKHLTMVERNWFPTLLAPEPGDVYLTSDEDAAAQLRARRPGHRRRAHRGVRAGLRPIPGGRREPRPRPRGAAPAAR